MSNDEYEPVGENQPYVESQVIMTTVRVIVPFTFTYGLYLTFHGGGSPGGGFQGGAIIGATILMIAFAFGIEPTREWLSNRVVVGLASGGVLAFALIGLIPVAIGGRFLEHGLYESALEIYHGKKYALEGVEIIGIMPIVAGVVVGLFFVIAAGFSGGGRLAGDGGERSSVRSRSSSDHRSDGGERTDGSRTPSEPRSDGSERSSERSRSDGSAERPERGDSR
ncbi:MAG TPA: MnhB domain-containing protein [Natronoarchaeum rubrum]|nr:MnhB domain-containing protein [Natronoarchaeum rubrum]